MSKEELGARVRQKGFIHVPCVSLKRVYWLKLSDTSKYNFLKNFSYMII